MRLVSTLALLRAAPASALAPIERRTLLKGAAAASTITAAPALAKPPELELLPIAIAGEEGGTWPLTKKYKKRATVNDRVAIPSSPASALKASAKVAMKCLCIAEAPSESHVKTRNFELGSDKIPCTNA